MMLKQRLERMPQRLVEKVEAAKSLEDHKTEANQTAALKESLEAHKNAAADALKVTMDGDKAEAVTTAEAHLAAMETHKNETGQTAEALVAHKTDMGPVPTALLVELKH